MLDKPGILSLFPNSLINSIKHEHSFKVFYICNKGSTHVIFSIYAISDGPDTTYSSSTYSTTTEDLDARETDVELAEGLRASNKLLIEKLLHKLNRQKRTPVAHGIEMLLAIDHLIYNE